MVAGCSSNGFPGPQVGFCGVEGFKKMCNLCPKGASVHLHLPPESLRAGIPLQEGKRISKGG